MDFKEISAFISEQNPWRRSSEVPGYLAPETERNLTRHLWKYVLSSNLRKHLIIFGPRRVGKTTVMYQTVRHLIKNKIPTNKIQWVRLDHPKLMTLGLDDIVKEAVKRAKATREEPLYLFLDELIYAENWDLWLKTFYDEHWPVHIIASSSATAALQRGKESGVGRWQEFYLGPYLLTELLKLYGLPEENKYRAEKNLKHTIESLAHSIPLAQLNFNKECNDLIAFGGFPEILNERKIINKTEFNQIPLIAGSEVHIKSIPEYALFFRSQQALRADSIERAIYKDIPQSYRVDNPIILERLLYMLAGQVTGLLSTKKISEDISQVSIQTLDRYINYLIHSYLIFTLSNYDSNERGVQRRQRKVYFVDSAIRNSTLLKDSSKVFDDPVEFGKLLEGLTAGHLYYLGKQANIRLYHWRRSQNEVDFIYNDPVCPMAFEVGSSSRHPRKGLKKFLEENPHFKNNCYYAAPNLPFISAEDSPTGIGELPLDLLLLAVGLQQDQVLSVQLSSL